MRPPCRQGHVLARTGRISPPLSERLFTRSILTRRDGGTQRGSAAIDAACPKRGPPCCSRTSNAIGCAPRSAAACLPSAMAPASIPRRCWLS
jgi:hypothetical protein